MVTLGSDGILALGKLRWLRALVWMVVLAVASVLCMTFADKLFRIAFGSAPSDAVRAVASLFGAVVLLTAYYLAVRFAERRPASELALAKLPKELGLGLAIGGGMIALIVGLQAAFGWVIIESRSVDAIAIALRDSIRSGVMEELLMRLIIIRLMWRAFGVWPALVFQAGLFGFLHLANPGSDLFAAICLIAGEGVLIGLYLMTGRIWAPIGAHAGWNFAQGWIFGAAVSGTDSIAGGPLVLRPDPNDAALLSGGEFGPEASLAALLVSLLGSAIALWLTWRKGAFRAREEDTRV